MPPVQSLIGAICVKRDTDAETGAAAAAAATPAADDDDDVDDNGDVDDVSSSVNQQSVSKYARHIQEISPTFC